MMRTVIQRVALGSLEKRLSEAIEARSSSRQLFSVSVIRGPLRARRLPLQSSINWDRKVARLLVTTTPTVAGWFASGATPFAAQAVLALNQNSRARH